MSQKRRTVKRNKRGSCSALEGDEISSIQKDDGRADYRNDVENGGLCSGRAGVE